MKKTILFFAFFFGYQFANATGFFWVNGTGSWNDFANHWATTSGGTNFHANPPQPTDDVFFDGSSFTSSAQIVWISSINVFCKNFNFQNTVPGIHIKDSVQSNTITIFGSITVGANTDLTSTTLFSFVSTSTGNTVDFADSVNCRLEFNSPQGEWTLLSPLVLGNYKNLMGEINLVAGTLNSGNFPITVWRFNSNNGNSSRTFNQGSSVLYFFGEYSSSGTATTNTYLRIDSLLNFDPSVTEIICLSPTAPDTGSFSFNLFRCDWNIYCANQHFNKISCFAPPSNYGTNKLFHIIFINGNENEVKNVNLTNTTFHFQGKSFAADSILCSSGLPGYSQAAIITSANQNAAYIESPSIWIEAGRDSNYPFLIASGDIHIDVFCNMAIPATTNYFNTVIAGTDMDLQKSCGTVNITKCIIGGNGQFNSSCVFDTLMFSPGGSYSVYAGDTVTVNNEFVAYGNAIKPIQINSQTTGSQSTMIFNQGNTCSDYLFLRDMAAVGSNVSAGSHSIDISNNTGWLFTPCSTISNVWPGDANYDLIVNNADILPIGIAYGDTGSIRQGASLTYSAQPAADWFDFFSTAVNKKHADCDGNGIVDASDTSAIALNYGLTHPAKGLPDDEITTVGPPLYLLMPSGTLTPGSVVNIPVMLGTTSMPVSAIYGIAFSINYNPALLVPGSISLDYSGSWMVSPGNMLHIERDFTSGGYLDCGLTRINKTDASGLGMIATLSFTVAQGVNDTLWFSFSHISAVRHDYSPVAISTLDGSVIADVSEQNTEINAVWSPNPFTNKAQLVFSNPEHEKYVLAIYDTEGRMVCQQLETTDSVFHFERKNLSGGICFYELRNEKNTIRSHGKFILN